MLSMSFFIPLFVLGLPAAGLANPQSTGGTPQDGRLVDEPAVIMEEPGAAEEELSRQFRLGEPGIQGVIVDRTITMTGKTFFRQFSQLSLDRPVIANANLAIHERPSARWGSQVWITEGNRVIFEATMPPRLSDIDEYVDIAIEQVEELIIRQTILEALDSDPDLADEEI
jgi:curli production assembly/transport component CsgE